MKTVFLYRRGDGNEGDFPRMVVDVGVDGNPYAALKALVLSDYIAGTRTRKHISANILVDGEAEFGLHAVVDEGPKGETAFGAAWLTATLEPLSEADAAHYLDHGSLSDHGKPYGLLAILDRGARTIYGRQLRKDF